MFYNMKIKVLSALFCCLLPVASAIGQSTVESNDSINNAMPQAQLLDEQISNLMADHVGLKRSLAIETAAIEYVSREDLIASESLMYPADELYGSWDTVWVNPVRTKDSEVAFPDSFTIDCHTFVIPIDVSLKVTSNYGPRRRRMHKGIDLKVQVGDTIRAAFAGKVRIRAYERRGYGYYLVLRHPNGLETIYGHLSKFLVNENEVVRAGTPIGLGGNTGRSTGSHLHFETRFLGQAINPSDIIDFETGKPYDNYYTVYKQTFGGGNVYTSTSERIVYHRIKQGETLSKIALMYHTTVTELCRLNGLQRNSKLRIGQTIRCGTTIDKSKKSKTEAAESAAVETTGADSVAIAETTVQALYHEVQPKETLSQIARQYNTTVDALCKLNNIYATSKLTPGQQICYRLAKNEAPRADAPAVQAAETVTANAENVSETSVSPPPATDKSTATPVYYRVKKGDTLGSIARKYGVTVDKLCKMNNITSTTILQIGRSIRCS